MDLPEKREQPSASRSATAEGLGPRDPIAVSGRDWAGEGYTYVFLLGQERVGSTPPAREDKEVGRPKRQQASQESDARGDDGALWRRVQIEARTIDFQSFEIRTTSTGCMV